MESISVSQNLLIFGEKILMSAELKGVFHMIHIFFGSALGKV